MIKEMAGREERDRAFKGKTYSLFGNGAGTEKYYSTVKNLADLFLQRCPDAKRLLLQVRRAGEKEPLFKKRGKGDADPSLISFIKNSLGNALPEYTTGVARHLRELPPSKRFDDTLTTKEEQYHLFMIEIELVNRIYREAFRKSDFKIALLPHCLRDFRPQCRMVQGDIDAVCRGCTEDCFINLGSLLLKKYGITPYISVERDQESLFRKLKNAHPDIGALGIACIPELARGMRLCIRLGIPPVGIPLDANRCARWMKEAHESSFALKELEELIR